MCDFYVIYKKHIVVIIFQLVSITKLLMPGGQMWTVPEYFNNKFNILSHVNHLQTTMLTLALLRKRCSFSV